MNRSRNITIKLSNLLINGIIGINTSLSLG